MGVGRREKEYCSQEEGERRIDGLDLLLYKKFHEDITRKNVVDTPKFKKC